MKPSIQFLEHVVKDPKKIFDDYILREQNRRKGIKPVNYYFGENGINKGDKAFDIDVIDDIEEENNKKKVGKKKITKAKSKPKQNTNEKKKKATFTINI